MQNKTAQQKAIEFYKRHITRWSNHHARRSLDCNMFVEDLKNEMGRITSQACPILHKLARHKINTLKNQQDVHDQKVSNIQRLLEELSS